MEYSEDIIMENVKKSQLKAKSHYDLHKLQCAGEHFLLMQWKEEEEAIEFQYDMKKMTSFTEIRKEEFVTVLNLLLQAAKFKEDWEHYDFSMEPSNLFYNTSGRICIKQRDLKREKMEDFLLNYKALVACAVTGEYSFADYVEGGEELLKKNRLTEPLFDMADAEAVEDYLERIKSDFLRRQKEKRVYVSKTGNRILKIVTLVLAVTVIALGIYGGIQYYKIIPYYEAVTEADNAYIENNNIALIDALKGVAVDEMEKHQKYILARAYLQSENLSDEQKKNVLDKLTLMADEKELEYWIYLGRMEVASAEDLALQLSDDELLLYAYMKEKAQIQADTVISGEEKEQKLQEIQSKIDSLAKKYQD